MSLKNTTAHYSLAPKLPDLLGELREKDIKKELFCQSQEEMEGLTLQKQMLYNSKLRWYKVLAMPSNRLQFEIIHKKQQNYHQTQLRASPKRIPAENYQFNWWHPIKNFVIYRLGAHFASPIWIVSNHSLISMVSTELRGQLPSSAGRRRRPLGTPHRQGTPTGQREGKATRGAQRNPTGGEKGVNNVIKGWSINTLL